MSRVCHVLGLAVLLFSLSCTRAPDEYPWLKGRDELPSVGMGTFDAPEPIESLIEALEHEDKFVRQKAALELGRRGRQGVTGIPSLIDGLTDQDEGVREASAHALGQMGREAFGAVPYLLKALGDPDESVRREAANSLGEISKEMFRAAPDVIESTEERAKAMKGALENLRDETIKTLEAEQQKKENKSIGGFIDMIKRAIQSLFYGEEQ